jgi:hypothetical protein
MRGPWLVAIVIAAFLLGADFALWLTHMGWIDVAP